MLLEDSEDLSVEVYKSLVNVGLVLVSQENDLQKLLRRILDFSMELAHADAGSIFLIRKEQLEFSAMRNLTFERENRIPQVDNFRLPLDCSTICGYVATTGNMVMLEEARSLKPGVPYKFCDTFDRQYRYDTHSLFTIPLTIRGGKVVGVLQLINHVSDGIIGAFPASLSKPLRIMAQQAGMALNNSMLTEDLQKSQLETVYRLALAAETRDNETGCHLKRVGQYGRLLAHQLGKGIEFEQLIYNAAPLHDVGKIGLPDCILKKTERFTEDERNVMQTHTVIGRNILEGSQSPLMVMGASIAYTHHEKWNGTGYPNRLQKEEIPVEGRLMAIVDVFDALSCKRCYKEAWNMDKVLATIRQERGHHFDPDMVDVFLDSFPDLVEIHQNYH
jgi:HD-GYP domain-containing protein (c-di-GMP phosphodiesterase class II)